MRTRSGRAFVFNINLPKRGKGKTDDKGGSIIPDRNLMAAEAIKCNLIFGVAGVVYGHTKLETQWREFAVGDAQCAFKRGSYNYRLPRLRNRHRLRSFGRELSRWIKPNAERRYQEWLCKRRSKLRGGNDAAAETSGDEVPALGNARDELNTESKQADVASIGKAAAATAQ
eukprot:IDg5794t1